MRAREHTQSMLRWWGEGGIDRVDLAVRRPDSAMVWHYDISLNTLPLPWVRAENVHHADVYIRPSRWYAWPLVFLDDVPVATAAKVALKYGSLVIRTSEAGGCHVWLSCSYALAEIARNQAQKWLAQKAAADPGSTSGEHLGRLAGFKNWKRGGTWVNVVDATRRNHPWNPKTVSSIEVDRTAPARRRLVSDRGARPDTSESGREWGWICGMLEAGYDSRTVYYRLIERASPRRGRDVERYALRTIRRALEHVGTTT